MPTLSGDKKFSLPAIVHQRFHWDFFPIGVGGVAMTENCVQDIMAVSKNVSRCLHALANRALDRKTASVDFRPDIFNDDSPGKRRFDGANSSPRHSWYRPPRVEFLRHSVRDRHRTGDVHQGRVAVRNN